MQIVNPLRTALPYITLQTAKGAAPDFLQALKNLIKNSLPLLQIILI